MADYPNYPPPPPLSPPVAPTSTLAIVSMISGILGWTILFGLGAVIAIITGHMAKNEIRNSRGLMSGDGLATAGLVLGYSNIVISAIGICLLIVLPLLGLGGIGLCLPFMNQINH